MWQTDGHTYRRTSCHGIVCAMHTRRAVKTWTRRNDNAQTSLKPGATDTPSHSIQYNSFARPRINNCETKCHCLKKTLRIVRHGKSQRNRLYIGNNSQWRSQKYFSGGANGGGLEAWAPSEVQGRSPGGRSGGGAPRRWRLCYKTNVQFLALAYINIQIAAYSCKVFFRADRAEIAQL